jgi:hypothetical protein
VLLMPRALVLAMTVLALPLGRASADAPPDPGANAALKYWQAFATLPRFSDAERKKLLAECLTMPLDAPARELVTKAGYSLRMMHHGAALPSCDWGIAWEDEGINVLLPHADGVRVLAALACLQARLRFAEGKSAEAVDDIVAGMTLARHTSRDGVNILLLSGYAVEHRMGEALAPDLPRLDAGMIRDLKKRLDALPPGGNAAASLRLEEKWALEWFIRKVKEAKDRDSLLAFLAGGLRESGDDRAAAEKARAFLAACGGTAAGVVRFAEETRSSYERMAEKMDLPPDQFEKEAEREVKKGDSNPVFKLLFPAIARVRWAQARADVRRALVSAALAVRLDGPAALKAHPDPVAGGPFEYVAFDGGFELRSKVKGTDDKPLALTVGRRGK